MESRTATDNKQSYSNYTAANFTTVGVGNRTGVASPDTFIAAEIWWRAATVFTEKLLSVPVTTQSMNSEGMVVPINFIQNCVPV